MGEMLNNLDWTVIVKMAGLVLSIIGGAASVPAINKLKSLLNWSGRKVQFLVVLISVLVALATNIFTGALYPQTVTPETVLTVFTLVLVASQAEYQRIQKEMEKQK